MRFDRKSAGLRASGKILQKEAPGQLVTAVPIYAELARGDMRFVERVFADGEETPIALNVPAGTRRLVVDPYGAILTSP